MKKRYSLALLLTLSFGCDSAGGLEPDEEVFLNTAPRVFGSWCQQGKTKTVVSFEQGATPPFNPEGLAFNPWGTRIYVSQALSGIITETKLWNRQTSVLAALPLGGPDPQIGCDFPIMGEIDTDWYGNVYAPLGSCDPANRGIWKVSPNGETELIASLPLDAFGNGLKVRKGYVYVADSFSPRIWRAPVDGDGEEAEVWVEDPLLAFVPNEFGAPGANGLQIFDNEVWVANASAFTVVSIPFEDESSEAAAGEASVLHENVGLDDFAIASDGTIFGTTDPFQTVVKVLPDGTQTVVLEAEDGLDGPTAAEFHPWIPGLLFITNAQFPFFPPTGNGPSLMSYQASCSW